MQFNEKISVFTNLTNIYGIGNKKAIRICENLGVSVSTAMQDLPSHKKDALNAVIVFLKKNKPGIDNELKLTIQENVKRLIEINSYRGRRHKANLPTRGQRTRSNARTVKRMKKVE